jgi:KaiC/GvpD/RAD55 family RecA-like ATPase
MSEYTTYADPVMAAVKPAWLVPGFLEFGQVVLLSGPGGCGKSFLTAHWAAAVTRGELPGLDGEPGSVGLINMEDDPNTATAWRLAAEGADKSRIIDLSESATGEPAELPRDSGLLRRAIDENGIRLLIIDPLSAVSSKSLTTVLQARKIIMPLQRAARETGCVILIVHHVRKDGLVAGSKGLVDSVRMAIALAPDEQVPSDRVLSVNKTNGTAPSAPLRFTIEGDGTDAHLAWLDREVTTQRRTAWRDDLAARRQAKSAPPAPAITFTAAVAVNGRNRVLATGITSLELARKMCEETGEARALGAFGHPLAWRQRDAQTWQAGNTTVAFAVLAAGGSQPCGRLAVSQKTRGSRPASAGHFPWPLSALPQKMVQNL